MGRLFTAMSSNTKRSSLSLTIVVVGAGMAGLAAAYTLRRAGHSVVVLEKKDAKSMFGGGCVIQSPANMIKLLYQWGLGPSLNEKGLKCDRMLFINGNSGDSIGSIAVREDLLKDIMPEMIIIQYGDLVKILYDLAIREGVEIRHNANVIHADPNRISVRLDTGETVPGDIIIAADGYTSPVRSSVTGFPSTTALESSKRLLLVAFTVETSLLEDDESFKPVLDRGSWTIWMAENIIFHTYLIGKGDYYGGSFSYVYNGPFKEGDEEWSDTRNLESYSLDLATLEPRLRKILKLSKIVTSRIIVKKPISDDFVNEHSSIVLAGEAAYPFVIDATHSPALMIEDAETLGILFSRLQCREQMQQLLTAYEEIRYPRCERVYENYQTILEAFKCPIGPQQEARDAALRQTFACSDWDNMYEATFRSVWGDQLSMVVYDVNEAVDDWWAKIGKSAFNTVQVSVFNE